MVKVRKTTEQRAHFRNSCENRTQRATAPSTKKCKFHSLSYAVRARKAIGKTMANIRLGGHCGEKEGVPRHRQLVAVAGVTFRARLLYCREIGGGLSGSAAFERFAKPLDEQFALFQLVAERGIAPGN